MRFLIITHVFHKRRSNQFFGYAPYVNEMNVWLKYADKIEVVAPFVKEQPNRIETAYNHENITFTQIPSIAFTSLKQRLLSLFRIPIISWKIFFACKRADHIQLRCPGNIGLLGCLVQIFFPNKTKTAKYAGNWDPESKQPLSYRLQKWILGNTFLTRNIKVLVYGDWKGQTKNIKSFFTATYNNFEIETPLKRDYSGHLNFMFVGGLVEGKRPLFAVKIVEELHKQGKFVHLDVYGDGPLKANLREFIKNHKLESVVVLHGNQSKDIIKSAFKTAHFSILPSKSEGWPKAIAEAMFFGVELIRYAISYWLALLAGWKKSAYRSIIDQSFMEKGDKFY